LAVNKGLNVPCHLHGSWANDESCRDISRHIKDYSLFMENNEAVLRHGQVNPVAAETTMFIGATSTLLYYDRICARQ